MKYAIFKDREIQLCDCEVVNPDHREYGDYHIDELWVDGELYRKMHGKNVCIPFSELEGKDAHTLRIVLK